MLKLSIEPYKAKAMALTEYVFRNTRSYFREGLSLDFVDHHSKSNSSLELASSYAKSAPSQYRSSRRIIRKSPLHWPPTNRQPRIKRPIVSVFRHVPLKRPLLTSRLLNNTIIMCYFFTSSSCKVSRMD